MQNRIENKNEEEKEEKKEDNILHKGWIKFQFIKSSDEKEAGDYFEINQSFSKKHKKDEQQEQDEYGPIDIPDSEHFFAFMNDRSIYITTGRTNDVIRTYKSIDMSYIKDIYYKEGEMNGGLKILQKEGEECWILRLKNKMSWVMCVDDEMEKTKWVQHIMRFLKLGEESDEEGQEGEEGAGGAGGTRSGGSKDIEIPNMGGPREEIIEEEAVKEKDADGVWLVIHDWSDCTLACGGGDSYQQRTCAGQRGKGKPCSGQEILAKKCNLKPCPTEIKEQDQEKGKAAMLQISRLSNRPQRYERCLVREGDMNLRVDLKQVDGVMPVRVVLNNQTISIFYNVEYETIYQTYDLDQLRVGKDKMKPDWCLQLQDNRDQKKQAVVCIHPSSLSPENTPLQEITKWATDIEDFKKNCNSKKQFHQLDSEADDLFNERKDIINKEQQEEGLSKLRSVDQKQQDVFDDVEEDNASKMVVDEVKKEIQFDSMAMQDELLREKRESDQLEASLNVQQEKSACLDKSMARKQKLQEIELKEKETEERVSSLKAQAQKEVESSREKTMKKIGMYRALADRRKFLKKEKLMQLKVSLATRLLNEQRKGDQELCSIKLPLVTQNLYCDNFFSDYKEKQIECKQSPMLFCFNCCEYEFGEVHEKERDSCYDDCVVEPSAVNIFLDVDTNQKIADAATNAAKQPTTPAVAPAAASPVPPAAASPVPPVKARFRKTIS